MTNVWKGLKATDRALIIERLYALSKAVSQWKDRCASTDVSAWVSYGQLDVHVDILREDLGEAFEKEVIEPDYAVVDGELTVFSSTEREAVETKLSELSMLLDDWAQACTTGKAVAWIMVGHLADHVERLWNHIYWHDKNKTKNPDDD